MIIRYLSTAIEDIENIRDYIAEDNENAANQVISRILQVNRYLSDFPRLGRPGLLPETRELSIKGLSYKTVYRIEGDIVLIVNIIHTSRNWP